MKFRVVAGAALAVSVGVTGVAAVDRGVDLRVEGADDIVLALEVLKTIPVEKEYSRGYKRNLFPHWRDVDGDGCDAREQVLKRDALGLPQVDPFRCFVVEADWLSPYDGRKSSDRTSMDIDHTVALKEAWDSGAWQWNLEQRTAYANDTSDPRTLVAVSASSNRSKGDRDPSNWMPQLRGFWCTYSANWIAVKARWGLSMDQSEWGRLNNVLSGTCAGTTMRGWNPPPGGTVSTSTTPATTATRAPTTTAIGSGSSASSTTQTNSSSTTQPTTGSLPTVRPGAFCAPEGAVGTYRGRTYVCSTTSATGTPYVNGAKRWRQQN
ncbi:MAG: GmrSD restriction endonuclease domain-containing protein [Ilumatobacteraceae bacterium]